MQYVNGSVFAHDYARMYSPLMMCLADRLDEAMKEAREHGPNGISQTKLHQISKVPQATISRTLKGATDPEIGTIRKLANALNVTFEWLNEGRLPKYKSELVKKQEDIAHDAMPVSKKYDVEANPEEYAEVVRLFGKAPRYAKDEALRILSKGIRSREAEGAQGT